MITKDETSAYLAKFKSEPEPLIQKMEAYATQHHIPIMESEGISTFIGLLALQQPKRILEIGSAIGYSAIRMSQAFPNTSITTIEREESRYKQAVAFIEQAKRSSQISVIHADALELDFEKYTTAKFDTLFIDAAKGQYQNFFEKYTPYLEDGGVVYCDNMFMHGMVFQDIQEIPRRKRTMIRNLTAFTEWLMNHPKYDTNLLPVGDGILIAIKKEA